MSRRKLVLALFVACSAVAVVAPRPTPSVAAEPAPDADIRPGDDKKPAEVAPDHSKWVARCLREMLAIKPGMTRADLLRVFQEEGGLSTRTTQRYAYRGCPFMKVDVTFEAVGALEDKLTKFPTDRITRISKPFLEGSIID